MNRITPNCIEVGQHEFVAMIKARDAENLKKDSGVKPAISIQPDIMFPSHPHSKAATVIENLMDMIDIDNTTGLAIPAKR